MALVMETRPAAYSVIIERGQILLCHYRTYAASGQLIQGWTLPGGGLEIGEQPSEAARREAREETGYTVAVENLLGVQAAYFPGNGGSVFCALRSVYRSHIVSGELVCERQGSTDRVEWVPLDRLDDRLPVSDRHRAAPSLLDTAADMLGYGNARDWANTAREGRA